MPQFSYKFQLHLTIYNRKYARKIIDSKTVNVTVVEDANELDLNELKQKCKVIKNQLDHAAVIQNDDPYLIHLLEPKSGATVHNLLNEIRSMEKDIRILGNEVPPETLNGFKVFIMNKLHFSPTLEGIAKYIQTYVGVSTVIIDDGEFEIHWP